MSASISGDRFYSISKRSDGLFEIYVDTLSYDQEEKAVKTRQQDLRAKMKADSQRQPASSQKTKQKQWKIPANRVYDYLSPALFLDISS